MEASSRFRGGIATVVYLDVYFLINFAMDALCLYTAGFLLGSVPTVRRLALGAGGGAVFSCLMLLLPEKWYTILFSVLSAFLLFFLCYPRLGAFTTLTGGILFFAASALISGIFSAAVNAISGGKGLSSKGVVLLILSVSASCALLALRAVRARSADRLVEIEICLRGETIILPAIVDTGNLLREPISGTPVAVLSQSLSERISALLGKDAPMRWIPANTVCGSKSLMAFRPEEAVLIRGKSRSPVTLYFALSECSDFGTAQCLLPAAASRKEFLCSASSSKN